MNDPLLTQYVLAQGVVQGVGYREFTRRWALRLNISGWVRNRSDGAVEALVRGAASDVEAILAQMRHGPPGAEVASLRVAERGEDEAEAMEAFVVRATL